MKNFILFPVGVMLVVAAVAKNADANIDSARVTVSQTIHVIYRQIVANSGDDESLRAVANDVVSRELLPKLNVSKFSKLILAAHWKKATEQQRAEFTRILTQFLLRSFVTAIVSNHDRLDTYLDSITIKQAKPGKREGRAIVPLIVRFPGSNEVKIDFRMTNEDNDGWKVYDVVFEGVSFAINYRTILNSEIKRSGIDAVTANLAEKLTK
ncbi:MAG: ABC transporter substrate-binding protein [Acidiferrobacterales bacterium]|nr:ABC transporter substrate-binding protein [Acidiferrobacterales bacterium]